MFLKKKVFRPLRRHWPEPETFWQSGFPMKPITGSISGELTMRKGLLRSQARDPRRKHQSMRCITSMKSR